MTKTCICLSAALLLSGAAFGADTAAGKVAYDKSCKSCHGAAGEANPAIAKMMKVDMRNLGSAEVQANSDADLKKIVTDGKGKMKGIKTVAGADVDNVVAYLRTFKK
jgi:mono/diheme cytochrome c family protein